MSTVKIYHNPRCSKSRQTLELLEQRGILPDVVNYLDTPPSVAELDALCTALGLEPLQLIRAKEARFQELGLSRDDQRPRTEWLQLIHDNPVLLERPLVVRDGRAALGRPPENVLAVL